jgi:amino acid adenylation domain-containing protein
MTSPRSIDDLSPGERRELLAMILKERAADVRRAHPLSSGQQALWVTHQRDPEQAAYNIALASRIRTPLDIDALRRALQVLVERHAALRTTFTVQDGLPAQIVHAEWPLAFEIIDAPGASQSALQELVAGAIEAPFDLENGPVFRVALFPCASDDVVLLLSMHHIVGDAWSCGVLMDELGTLYAAETGQARLVLTPPRRQYGDFVNWQTRMLAGSDGAQHREYWHHQLAGPLPALELPTDRPRQKRRRGRGATSPFQLDGALTASLRALARAERVSLYTVMLGAFQVLLHRYSGQDDILIGSPMAGRGRADFHGTVGYFVSPVVIRADLSSKPTFRAWLAGLRSTVHGALAHQDYPFPILVRELQPARDASRSPIFDVMFNLLKLDRLGLTVGDQATSASPASLGGLSIEPFPVRQEEGQFDLVLEIGEGDAELFGVWKYDTDLFDEQTIVRMQRHYLALLEGIIADPDVLVTALPMLASAERARLLGAWNDTAVARATPAAVHELVEAQSARTPDAVAVAFNEQAITYSELNARANQLARCLRAAGVGPGVLVGIALDRSLEMLVGVLGVLKAGGGYVPLDPTYPADRLQFMLNDSRAAVLLVDQPLAWSESDAPIISLQTERTIIDHLDTTNLSTLATPDDVAYVIYTSGSTGQPKGVRIPHRAVVNLLQSMQRAPGITADDTLLAVTTLSFDIAVLELLLPLVVGATVVIAPREVAMDGAALRRALAECQATVMQATPATWHMLLEAGWDGQPHVKALCGGEALTADLATRLLGIGVELWNMYGPTETTVWSTIQHVQSTDRAISIGRPIDNTRAYVLDAELQPVPVGIAGQLYIAGQGVAHGYLDRPELTQERFVADPFATDPEARMYRTGDLARWLNDGTLEHMGRADAQVKLRGYRIELGEIEAALERHPSVAQAAATVREDVPGDRRLLAYLVTRPGATVPSASELRAFLHTGLPEYMLPAAYVHLEALPLTPNRKLDRRALPAPAELATSPSRSWRAPRTPIEEALCGIWGRTLNLTRVGIDDDFFELGGHSLLASRLIVAARDTFAVDVPLRCLFEAPTVAGMARAVDGILRGTTVAPPAIQRSQRSEPAPLAFAQERMWYLEQLSPGSAGLGMPITIRLRGALDAAILERGLVEIVRRHEALRTAITTRDGRPVQVVDDNATLSLKLVDLADLEPSAREDAATRTAAATFAQAIDLERPPLLHATLVRMDTAHHLLLLHVHHIGFDGWSLGVFASELEALYRAFAAGDPSPLRELPFQYGDFALWQRQTLTQETLRDQLAYWRRQLEGSPALLALPTDRARPAVRTFSGHPEQIDLSVELTEALKSLSAREGATPFMTLLAAFKLLLARHSGQDDVPVGTPVAGRTRPELESLIGVFLNLLVLRTDVSGNPAFSTLLKRVREVALGAYAHQDVPFERLLSELQPPRDASRTPLFQVLFNMMSFPVEAPNLPGLSAELVAPPELGANFDLTLYVIDTEQRFRISLVYNADLFEAERMAELLQQYVALLEQVAADPRRRIGEYSLRTASAAAALPDPTLPLEPVWDESVVDRFSRHAQAQPDAIAVLDDHESWTYGQLEARSNQLAHRLHSASVGAEDLVAIYGHRGVALVCALLGVLKAGAGFAILDPRYPPVPLIDRLRAAEPIAFVQLDDAGALPEALQVHVDAIAWRCRVTLARSITAEVFDELATESIAPVHVKIAPDSLAYVAFTSGTTGQPRAIAGTHRPLAHFMAWHTDTFGLQASDRFSMLSGLSHDPLLRDIFAPLWIGATLVITEWTRLKDPERLAGWMAEHRISVAHLTPALAKIVSASGRSTGDLDALRWTFFGGELLTQSTVTRLRRLAPNVTCVNFYGTTETPQAMAYRVVEPSEDQDADRGLPIGRGIDGVQLLVLNAAGQLTGVGERGEICIRTPYLTRGYLRDDVLTRQRFISNPFTSHAADRVYRTGDLGRYRANGEVEFAGRADHQLKLRGLRVEPAEIEAALERQPGIAQATVVMREDAPGDRRLVAYIVSTAGALVQPTELRTQLQAELPDALVPSAFVVLDAMALTPNGKVDWHALPAPGRADLGSLTTTLARDEVEARLVEIWQEVLGTAPIGVRDSFFDVGGHSLLAVHLFARIRDEFGKNLPLTTLLEEPTIEHVARAISGATDDSAWAAVVPLQLLGSKPPLFCVHGLGGYVSCFAELARQLGEDQPLYGIQARGLDGVQEPLESVEEMATEYIAQMRAVQPNGPYYLAGYSTGGAIALEMAQQLQASGEEVRFLMMLESAPRTLQDHRRRWRPRSLRHFFQELPFWTSSLLFLSNTEKLATARFTWAFVHWSLWTKLRHRLGTLQPTPPVVEEPAAADLPAHHQQLRLMLRKAGWAYAPQPYAGRITLMRSIRHLFVYSFDRRMGWDDVALGGVDVDAVPGDHEGILAGPNAAILARKMRRRLAEAQAGDGQG